ncbi:MAG: DEAD/DEAH box helicase [Bacteroidales bacterium]|nr:DEAD/DEAH box helicase [Bacteroidales bacterium]MDD3160696.1 DEAD/DEAH box helicase [Bacteroidales bacterium]
MKTFDELGVAPEILKAIQEMGYEKPMPVQEEVIPFLLGEMNEVIALAQTGTGKTAAYGIPVIQCIDIRKNQPQALILCPTRELCLQIAGDLQDYSKYVDGLKVLPVYGGSSIESQINSLKRGVHIIVATPGRLIDLIGRNTVRMNEVGNVILDEADEMLNMGFSESIDEILAEVPSTRNMLLFSATMPAEIAKITKKYMKQPREIVIGNKNESNENVKHQFYTVQAKDKYLALKRIADYYPSIYGIIFCRTRKETQEIADHLIEDGYSADSLHGELSQAQRDNVMQKFRIKNIQLLVATDVAARGLDVDDLTHVIHYGLPDETESYNHRSGRTGRAGKTGTSIAIVHIKEKGKIRQIEKGISKKFEERTIPNGNAICEKQLIAWVDKLEKVKVEEEQITEFLPSVFRKLEWLEKDDLLKRLVSLEFNRLMAYYRNAPEIKAPDAYSSEGRREAGRDGREGREGRDRGPRRTSPGFTRMFINIGKVDGIYPNTLIEVINQNVRGRVGLGKIDLLQNFSFFEVESSVADKVINSMNKAEFLGRRVSVEIAQEKQGDDRGERGGSDRGERSGSERSGRFGRRPETQDDYASVRKSNFAKRKEGDRNRGSRTNDRGSFGTRKTTERKKRY